MSPALAGLTDTAGRLYRPGPNPELVFVPELSFLMINGQGDPNGSAEYTAAIQALYSVSYTLKFALKRAGGLDFKVGALEGLWWVQDMAQFSMADKAAWQWTAMIRQPDEITAKMVAVAAAEVASKKHLPAARQLRLERFEEGQCAQVLHVGSYAAEEPTIRRLHAFINDQGYELFGKHHEIYLSDPRLAAPDRLKTIIRQPIGIRTKVS